MNQAQKLLAQWAQPIRLPPEPRRTTHFGHEIAVPSAAVLPQPAEYPRIAEDRVGNKFYVWRGIPSRLGRGRYAAGYKLRWVRQLSGVGTPRLRALGLGK